MITSFSFLATKNQETEEETTFFLVSTENVSQERKKAVELGIFFSSLTHSNQSGAPLKVCYPS